MWMSQTVVEPFASSGVTARSVGIAVPARNEASTIVACLSAIDAAAGLTAASVEVLVLVNNARDATAAAARTYHPLNTSVSVVEVELAAADAHAGGARRAALDRCAAMLPASGVLMTTDADSLVAPGWIAANLAEIAAGADAVAGVVAFDAATRATLPELPARGLEWRLAGLQARLTDLLDPRAHNPWPSHIWAWGASLALTVDAYRRIGGLPSIPLAEDRALAEAIERHDLCLRRSHAPVVYTSARQIGRAPGGFADLVASYASDAAAPCDAALEPTAMLVRRLRWRARLRQVHAVGGAGAAAQLASTLAVEAPCPSFGAFWQRLENRAPALARRRLLPHRLAFEVRRAERLIALLERAARRAGSPLSDLAA